MDAATAPKASSRISKNVGTRPASSRARVPSAAVASKPGSTPPSQSKKITQMFSSSPTHTMSPARLRPYSSLIRSVQRKVIG